MVKRLGNLLKLYKNLLILIKMQKKLESKKLRVSKTKNGKIMLSLRCAICGNKKFHQNARFLYIVVPIKNQNFFEQDIIIEIYLFQCINHSNNENILNKFLLAADSFETAWIYI